MNDTSNTRAEAPVGEWRLRWRRFRRQPSAMASLMVLLALVLFTLADFPLEYFWGIDPDAQDLGAEFCSTSSGHWLGHDDLGRDVLVRLMKGGQVSLLVGIIATFLGSAIGLLIGITAGYYGRWLDSVLMRFTDGMIALPLLPLIIVLGSLDLTKIGFSAEFAHSDAVGFWRIVVLISIVEWTPIARLVRAATLSVRERDFVAFVRGAAPVYTIVTHILPNIASPIIVAVTLSVGQVILFESVLSYLGFGIVPPTPSWGNMLTNAQEFVFTAPCLAIYPGVLIFTTVIAVNFVGDGLQHAFDARSERDWIR